ncbi:TetR/AcrR family transcriptional regulator [Methylobacterium sp. 2A]|nr:TetR/AcrR family transcriptional regulator [Methylobacterium sp. 2A]
MRKPPQQQRSRIMVASLVEAGARILSDRGWAGFTTNEVARVAGASVGSLYQYFPDKLAIAESIRQRHLSNVLAALPNPDAQDRAIPIARQVEHLVDSVLAVHAVDQRLHRVMLEEVPFAPRARHAAFESAFEQAYHRRYEALVRAAGCREDAALGTAASVLSGALEGLVHGAVRRGAVTCPSVRREATLFATAYLRARQGE